MWNRRDGTKREDSSDEEATDTRRRRSSRSGVHRSDPARLVPLFHIITPGDRSRARGTSVNRAGRSRGGLGFLTIRGACLLRNSGSPANGVAHSFSCPWMGEGPQPPPLRSGGEEPFGGLDPHKIRKSQKF